MRIISSIVLFFLIFSLNVFAKVNVITTIKPLADIFKEIGKDKVKVNYIIPPNISFHLYEYKISDIKKISNADIFVYLGSGEPNVNSLLKVVNGKVINAGSLIPENLLITKVEFDEDNHSNHKEEHQYHHHHHTETFHPALWLDPRLAILIADRYYKTLIEIDPKNKDYYYKNYSDFTLKTVNLYTKWKNKFDSLKNKYFISYHYLYPYLTRAFSLEYLAVIELGHGREPTIKHILHITNLLKEKNIEYIFVSKQFYNPRYLALVKKAGIKVIYLDPIGLNKSYLEMMNWLLKSIYRGLSKDGK